MIDQIAAVSVQPVKGFQYVMNNHHIPVMKIVKDHASSASPESFPVMTSSLSLAFTICQSLIGEWECHAY